MTEFPTNVRNSGIEWCLNRLEWALVAKRLVLATYSGLVVAKILGNGVKLAIILVFDGWKLLTGSKGLFLGKSDGFKTLENCLEG